MMAMMLAPPPPAVGLMSQEEFLEESQKLNSVLRKLGSIPDLQTVRDRLRQIACSLSGVDTPEAQRAMNDIAELSVDIAETMCILSVLQ